MHRVGCLVVVLVLSSAFLHVKVSVKVVSMYINEFRGVSKNNIICLGCVTWLKVITCGFKSVVKGGYDW